MALKDLTVSAGEITSFRNERQESSFVRVGETCRTFNNVSNITASVGSWSDNLHYASNWLAFHNYIDSTTDSLKLSKVNNYSSKQLCEMATHTPTGAIHEKNNFRPILIAFQLLSGSEQTIQNVYPVFVSESIIEKLNLESSTVTFTR